MTIIAMKTLVIIVPIERLAIDKGSSSVGRETENEKKAKAKEIVLIIVPEIQRCQD